MRKGGGGVDADSIHEIDYVLDVFGFPSKVYAMRGHYSKRIFKKIYKGIL